MVADESSCAADYQPGVRAFKMGSDLAYAQYNDLLLYSKLLAPRSHLSRDGGPVRGETLNCQEYQDAPKCPGELVFK